VPLSDLLVKVLISTDGIDANSNEVDMGFIFPGNDSRYGHGIIAVDNDNIIVQTGSGGMSLMLDNGTTNILDTDNYYYKIVVKRII